MIKKSCKSNITNGHHSNKSSSEPICCAWEVVQGNKDINKD